MSAVLKADLRLLPFAPFFGDLLIAVGFHLGAPEAVFAAEQAPVAAPHAVTGRLVGPEHPAEIRLIHRFEAVVPRGLFVRIKLAHQHRRAEVGIVVMTAWRRQGYAAEALAQLVRYSVERLHLHQLYAFVAADNEASLGLFRKSGFTSGSLLSDWLFDGREYHDALLLQLFL